MTSLLPSKPKQGWLGWTTAALDPSQGRENDLLGRLSISPDPYVSWGETCVPGRSLPEDT